MGKKVHQAGLHQSLQNYYYYCRNRGRETSKVHNLLLFHILLTLTLLKGVVGQD